MRTTLCDEFGIDVPIFAFSHCRDVVAAVTNAGGMGVLGALAFSPEQLDIELKWIDDHVDGKPYGVDIVMPMSYQGKEELMLPAKIADTYFHPSQQHRSTWSHEIDMRSFSDMPWWNH